MRRDVTPEDDALQRLRQIEGDVERQLREAADSGRLAGLPGEGAPLQPDADEGLGDRWAAAHVMRNANVSPEWVELRREIAEERERLIRRVRAHHQWLGARSRALRTLSAERILDAVRATGDQDRRFQRELAEGLSAVNAKIARYNLHVRAQLLQLMPLTAEMLADVARKDGS